MGVSETTEQSFRLTWQPSTRTGKIQRDWK